MADLDPTNTTRTGKRTPVTLKIKFKSETIEQFIERYAVDVSQGGIFIRTKEPLAVGTQMKFEFQLRDASPLIAGEGTVVWTRENDPSRPAIAPGMGVRFDRLAEGSPTVLERILSEKIKQTPSRNSETTKPPLFRDEPTRVAPAPVQDMLKAADAKPRSARNSAVPWQSDAEDFPEEAFEEQTKVRSLDELVAQTAQSDTPDPARELFGSGPAMNTTIIPPDELAMRRQQARQDATIDDASATAPLLEPPPPSEARSVIDRDSAPNLPNPPSAPQPMPQNPSAGREPRLLDTTPSPRAESGLAADSAMARTRLGLEPAKADTKPGVGPVTAATAASTTAAAAAAMTGATAEAKPVKSVTAAPPIREAQSASPSASASTSMGSRRPLSEPSRPVKSPSIAPIIVLVLAFVAAAAAAVWFFVLKEPADDDLAKTHPTTQPIVTPPTPIQQTPDVATPGSAEPAVTNGSATHVATGSNAANTGSGATKPAKLVDTSITAPNAEKATVTVDGTTFSGPTPLTAKLEAGKVYKAHVSAPGFITLDLDVKGGQPAAARLAAKPRMLMVTSEPAGAQIMIEGVGTGHVTPFEVDVKAFANRSKLHVILRKPGFKTFEETVDASAPNDDGTRLTLSAPAASLVVQPVQQYVPPPRPPITHGSADTGTPPTPTAGSAATPTPATPTPPTPTATPGSAATPPPSSDTSAKPATPPPGSEPEPDFAK